MTQFADPARLAKVAPDDFRAIRTMQKEWGRLLDSDLYRLDALYAQIIATAQGLLDPAPRRANILPFRRRGAGLSERDAYLFLTAASDGSYLTPYNAGAAAHQRLAEHHDALLTLIRRFIATPNRQITKTHLPTDTGNLSDAAQALIELYFYHVTFGPQGDRLRAEVARLIPDFLRAFPDNHGNLLNSLLARHPDGPAAIAPLLDFYVAERGMIDSEPVKGFAFEMLSTLRERDDFFFKHADKLIAPLLAWVKADPDARLAPFIERFVLTPLDCEIPARDAEIARLQHNIARAEAHLNAPEADPILSPDIEAKFLARDRAELTQLQDDFDGWLAARWLKAVQRVAVSATTRKTLTAIRKGLAPVTDPRLEALLTEAEAYRTRPRKFPMPKKGQGRFKDFGLKLLVIEELMYRQQVLLPRFDIHEFAREYDKREISVEDDGYAIIPEVETYFMNLPIPDELLARVTQLHQSSGLDGGAKFLDHLYPFWDPGCGDEVIPLNDTAIADLALLPNLRRIDGLENSRPSEKLLAALAARGIELAQEKN